jgi:hypothetical protein
LIKIEEKNQCCKIKANLQNLGVDNIMLYNSDVKEIEITEEGLFSDPNTRIIIATSAIQSGQSLKEPNLLQIFVQMSYDTVSSVQQFIGRNRLKDSTTHLFLMNSHFKDGEDFNYKTANNRYKTQLNKFRAQAFIATSIIGWMKFLKNLGEITLFETLKITVKSSKINLDLTEKKEFSKKKALYEHYSRQVNQCLGNEEDDTKIKISKKNLGEEYVVKERWICKTRTDKKRVYYIEKRLK